MTDPLGQSQIINYLIGLRSHDYQFDILSFEKEDRYKANKVYIQKLLSDNHINWYPQVFHSTPPVLSKIYDKVKLFYIARKLQKSNNYDLIHCRSYMAAEVGLYLKKRSGVKFLFDMRGFWADEKADGGSWNRDNWFWNKVYLFYKKKEKEFVKQAAHIVSLTYAAKKEIEKWDFYNKNIPISVIPCCADSEHFTLNNHNKQKKAREILSISEKSFVLSYLGSLGAWYMFDEMIDFFQCLSKKNKNAVFLLITNSPVEEVKNKLIAHNIKEEKFRVTSVLYREVPKYMAASDISISFIKPVYSKMSSSPVKIGETLSMGIPMIISNIGDAGKIEKKEVCYLVNEFTKEEYNSVIDTVLASDLDNKELVRASAKQHFSLQEGINKYKEVYKICC